MRTAEKENKLTETDRDSDSDANTHRVGYVWLNMPQKMS